MLLSLLLRLLRWVLFYVDFIIVVAVVQEKLVPGSDKKLSLDFLQ